jgi:hypothetical protein
LEPFWGLKKKTKKSETELMSNEILFMCHFYLQQRATDSQPLFLYFQPKGPAAKDAVQWTSSRTRIWASLQRRANLAYVKLLQKLGITTQHHNILIEFHSINATTLYSLNH